MLTEISSRRAGLQDDNSATDVCATLRGSRHTYCGNWIHRRQDAAAWNLCDFGLLAGGDRFRHLDQRCTSGIKVRGDLLGRLRYIPMHSEHGNLAGQQHRGRIQTWYLARFGGE